VIRTKVGLIAAAVACVAAALAVGSPSAVAQPRTGRPVIVVGIAGLRWSDISPSATPAIWRLAQTGSVGSLVTTTVHTITCPADAWLTLNAGRRAAEPPHAQVRCPPVPVTSVPGRTVQARVPGMAGLIAYNNTTGYQPVWGTLRTAAGPGRCSMAIGPGAALALADRSGHVDQYLAGLPATTSQFIRLLVGLQLRVCPTLTVIDLGNLPPAEARAPAVAAADQRVAEIVHVAPANAVIVVAGLGESASTNHGGPHLRAIVISGPGYRSGLLTSAATRQPGMVTITDLTPSVFGWLGRPVPAGLVGSAITSGSRGPLAAEIKTMIGQDEANQVYRSIVGWFFLYFGLGEVALFALIALALPGGSADRARRRAAWYTGAAVFGAAVPAGTFLAGLVPWGQLAHPAIWLYGLGFGWAAVIGVAALIGPWRKAPFGPPGFVCAVTVAVIGIDVITGSRLQIGAPFGLSLVEAGRLYGVGNNALGVYVVAGMLTAAWAAATVLRRRSAAGGSLIASRRAAAGAAGTVALATVIASGWPGFGAKVGGTIAMVPAYLVLIAAIGGVRITPRRGLAIAVSGVALVAVFAVIDYVIPAVGPSHLGGFVGQLVHGGAGGTLRRKISSNLHSLTQTWFTPVVPVIAIVTGLMLAWPERMRLKSFVRAAGREPLLRPSLFVVWLAAVLGWLFDDSGVSVAAAALPVALPLAIALVARTANSSVDTRISHLETSLCEAATMRAAVDRRSG
jgi:hypothetical protein